MEFEPLCVFSENKPRRAFWRGAKSLVLYVDGQLRAVRFGAVTDELQTAWTKKESAEFVNKQIAKALQEVKPIKMWQFAVIMALLVFILILQLRTMGVIRV